LTALAPRYAMRHPIRLLGFLAGILALQSAAAKKDQPEVSEYKFDGEPTNLLYFEDSDVILVTDYRSQTVFQSNDAGKKWSPVEGVGERDVFVVQKHPYNNKIAVIVGNAKTSWITKDQGETWTSFKVPEEPQPNSAVLSFHASDPDRMLFLAEKCEHGCVPMVYYTTDGFKTDPKFLGEGLVSCLWAKSTDLFATSDEKLDENKILCVAEGEFENSPSKYRVLMSDDYFDTTQEPHMSDNRAVSGVTNLAAVKGYIVFAAKSERTTEMALYVSNNTQVWHRAEFGEHKIEEDAYTLLESTNYSMQVDVMTTKPVNPMGTLLTSNSNGTFFTKNVEHTNRNEQGYVDFEKIANIQGVVLVNVVDNWEEIDRSFLADKKIKSQISFDDGHTWGELTVKEGRKQLHLHSVTSQHNVGRIFSSPAPGIVMGIGNTGDYLSSYEKGDLYVSHDAGLHWTLALESPHLYEFGAQGSILVAVEDAVTDTIKWSLDYGKKWEKMKLEHKFTPIALTTTPDSTSLKFLMEATRGSGSKLEPYLYALDFNDLHEDVCKEKDMEKWPARVDEKGEPICVMGHIQYFWRREADKHCIVKSAAFEDPRMEMEDCKCTKEDFECDYNFVRKDGECVPSGVLQPPSGVCKGDKTTFKGPSGYRLIPGNTCERKNGIALDEQEKEWDCSDARKPIASGEISHTTTPFKAGKVLEYYYLEREESSTGDDETIIMRTDRDQVFLTHDHGKNWKQVLEGEKIEAVYPHRYINDVVYLITRGKTVHYTTDRGRSFHEFKAPAPPTRDRLPILVFHPTQKNWLIWTGSRDCSLFGDCENIAFYSTHNGEEWHPLLDSVSKCQFAYHEERADLEKLVVCEAISDKKGSPLSLVSSNDWFEHSTMLKENVINFAAMAEYIIVAVRDDDKESLKVDASIDGVSFADAKFPPDFKVPHQSAYTVLDSSTHAVFLHVTVNGEDGLEYGSILKSNSNGTSYVTSADFVNTNSGRYVDFEKMQGIEGVAIINRVANSKTLNEDGKKKIKTYITHNDGSAWDLIARPENPQRGEHFKCSGNIDDCSLHLHGFSERTDWRISYSSPSAVGLMMATGNVGEHLGRVDDADTFVTRDGGLTWHLAQRGIYKWEYGDQGSIIVIVKSGEPTNTVLYSLNEGVDWIEYEFSEKMMLIDDISTVPSDTSRNFILWGAIGRDVAAINLDFSDMKERSEQCKLDEDHPDSSDSDYVLWSPKHPGSDDDCLFGHVAQYHRKKPDAQCYNGRSINHLHRILQTCECTREDFECDYNYARGSDGSCNLVPGLSPPDPEDACRKNTSLVEYNLITGYRRIPLTTCSGGKELDYTSTTKPCPHHEEEYNERHGISGVGLFFAIVLPIAAAAGIGFWVWKNWDGKFGRIQLGDGSAHAAFDRDAPWIKYPVMVLSAAIAVIAATPMLLGSLWRVVSARLGRGGSGGSGRSSYYNSRPFTSRSSFQRGNYAVVDPDEGELLGDESDEEV